LLRLALLLAVLLLVWGAAALATRRADTSAKADVFRLPTMQPTAIDTVVLTRPGDTVVLARKDTTAWTANGHPAAAQAITDLLAALADSTPGAELVAERRSSHAALGVDSAAGTRVQARGRGGRVADLVVGKHSPQFSGGYLRRADEESTYLVHGNLVDVLSRRGDEWRDHRIAAVRADSVAAVEISRGARRYAIRRGGTGWTLAPGGPADSARAADLVGAYAAVEAAGFASDAQADSARFSPADRKIRLLRKDGTPILTLLFDSTRTGFWVKPDTGRTVYMVETWVADRLAPADTSLRTRPQPARRPSPK
jgi:hypothetical protein